VQRLGCPRGSRFPSLFPCFTLNRSCTGLGFPLSSLLLRSVSVGKTSTTGRHGLSGLQRLGVGLLGLGLMLAWGLARWLEPDPVGHGTHRQLGLPPCSFIVLYGRRCPTCGMTTSWAHLARGQVAVAVRANVGGTLLGLLALAALPWILASAGRGRWWAWAPDANGLAWLCAAVFAVTLIDWLVRLWVG